MLKCRVFLLPILLILSTPAWTDEPPSGLILFTDTGSMTTMSCFPKTTSELECTSVTNTFIKDSKVEDFEKVFLNSGLLDMFNSSGNIKESQKEQFLELCDIRVTSMFNLILGNPVSHELLGMSEEELDAFRYEILLNKKKLSPTEKNDKLRSSQIMLDFCSEPTPETVKAIAAQQHDQSTRTCSINSNQSVEVYQKIKAGLWVYQTAPDNSACRRVRISTLSKKEGGQFWDWEYEFRTIVLDKTAKTSNGDSCSSVESYIDTYKFKTEPVFVGCDYIK